MIQFPDVSEHIIGIRLGQNGQYAVGTTSTEMEQGDPKQRVRETRPAFMASVTVICTTIGKLQINEFYLGDAEQTRRYFKWPCLHGFDRDVLMRFVAAPQNGEQPVGGAGLHEISISLMVRSLPTAPSAAELADVVALFDTIDAFYAAKNQMYMLDLQPQLDAWAALTVPIPEYTTFTHDVFEAGVFE